MPTSTRLMILCGRMWAPKRSAEVPLGYIRPYKFNSLISSLAVNFYASSVHRMRVHVSAEVLAYVLSAVHFRTTYSIHGRAQQTIIYLTQNIFWYSPIKRKNISASSSNKNELQKSRFGQKPLLRLSTVHIILLN